MFARIASWRINRPKSSLISFSVIVIVSSVFMKLPSALVAWEGLSPAFTLPCISVAFSRLLTAGCIKVSHILEWLDIPSRLFPFAVAYMATILGRVFQPECQSHSFRGLPFLHRHGSCGCHAFLLPYSVALGFPSHLLIFYPGVITSVHDVNDLFSL